MSIEKSPIIRFNIGLKVAASSVLLIAILLDARYDGRLFGEHTYSSGNLTGHRFVRHWSDEFASTNVCDASHDRQRSDRSYWLQ